jgi:hypothetical protein
MFSAFFSNRTCFSQLQLSTLEQLFLSTKYPDIYLRELVAGKIGLSEARVQAIQTIFYMKINFISLVRFAHLIDNGITSLPFCLPSD